ncbi:phage tail protein [Utexia brackfieldae]|uniref:phage tail protein n=1 Tax=Utexia brackfieldae TaxID=3074108 RepID=UPI00370DD34D
MKKPEQLRKLLEQSSLFIKTDPDKLHIFIEDGNIIATAAKSLSYEYQYKLNIVLLDYGESIDSLMVPVIAWMYVHQQEYMGNPELRAEAIKLDIEHLNNKSYDIGITLSLSERVIVQMGANGLEYKHVSDNPPEYMIPQWAKEICQMY